MNIRIIYTLTLITTFLGASVFPGHAKPIANNLGSLSNLQNQNLRNSGNDKLQSGQKQNPVNPQVPDSELSIIQLQDVMSKRAIAVQMTTQILNSTSY